MSRFIASFIGHECENRGRMFLERIKRDYRARHILWSMTLRQLKIKYAGSKMGLWWAVIIPLILAVCISFVFNVVSTANISHYTIFVLSGLLPWFFSTNALGESANSFISSSSLSKQGIFPCEFIPISLILANLLNFLIGLAFLLPLFIVINPHILKYLLFLCPAVFLHLIFILGLGLIFSFVNVFVRDLSYFLSVIFMVWFWLTPIFYFSDKIVSPFRWVYFINPLSYYIISYQNILFKAKPLPSALLFTMALISLLFFLAGFAVFIKKEPLLLKKI